MEKTLKELKLDYLESVKSDLHEGDYAFFSGLAEGRTDLSLDDFKESVDKVLKTYYFARVKDSIPTEHHESLKTMISDDAVSIETFKGTADALSIADVPSESKSKTDSVHTKKDSLIKKIIDKVTYVASWPAVKLGSLTKKINIGSKTLAERRPFKWFSEEYNADHKLLAKRLKRGVAIGLELGIIGGCISGGVAIHNKFATVQPSDELSEEEAETLISQIAELNKAVYNEENGLLPTIHDSVIESDYPLYLNVVDIKGISINTRADGTHAITFSVMTTRDKSGEGTQKEYSVTYSLTEEEFNAYQNSAVKFSSIFAALTATGVSSDSVEYFKAVDLEQLKDFVNGLTSFTIGKEPVIERATYYAIELPASEGSISPVINKYDAMFADEYAKIDATSLSEDLKIAAKAKLDESKLNTEIFTTLMSYPDHTMEHYFTYEMNEDGTYNVTVYASVNGCAPISIDLKVTNIDSILFSEADLLLAIQNFFNGVDQEVTVAYANTENAISNFKTSSNNAVYVWSYIENVANTSAETINAITQGTTNDEVVEEDTEVSTDTTTEDTEVDSEIKEEESTTDDAEIDTEASTESSTETDTTVDSEVESSDAEVEEEVTVESSVTAE